jgi:hypothetical protein
MEFLGKDSLKKLPAVASLGQLSFVANVGN